jgi:hypothetical protein
MKENVNKRQIKANRKNSKKSTGPRTTMGKKDVASNAVKHGILAKEIIIATGNGQENEKEFEILIEGLYQDFMPIGMMEELLTQEIAICYWRLRRAMRAEVGEIRCKLDNFDLDFTQQLKDKASWSETLDRLNASSGNFKERRRNSIELINIRGELISMLEYIKKKGRLTDEQIKKLFIYLGKEIEGSARLCYAINTWIIDSKSKDSKISEKVPSDFSAEKGKEHIIELLEYEIDRSDSEYCNAVGRERIKKGVNKAKYALPSDSAIEKILRYETSIRRRISRALKDLILLQQRRILWKSK